MCMPLTHVKAKTRNTLTPIQALHPLLLHTAHLTWRKILLSGVQSHTVPSRAPSLTDKQIKAHSFFLHHTCNSSSVPTVTHNLSMSAYVYVHNLHTLSVRRHAERHSHAHTHHPQEELQVLRGNPPSSENLVNGIINFLTSMNITQRQPPGYGGKFPANIHVIRIFGFTHPQLLLSAVLTSAKLSLLHWLGRPPGSGWLAWMVEDSWTAVHSPLLLNTKDRETLPAPISQCTTPTWN